MTTMDMKAGYWQIKVHKSDQDKTAFVTPFGMYRFTKMAFGLRNAPATFQRLIDRLRAGLGDVKLLAYLDDLILLSPTFEEHLSDLRKTFRRLKEFGLRISREKCHFACSSVHFLGHIITPDGISVNPQKVEAVVNMPPPRNVKQVQSFMQTCSWYRRFVPNFADVARPLSNLTKKDRQWSWTHAEAHAFGKLKGLLTSAPILRQADETLPYSLKTDASNYAIGAVLVQGEAEEEHPVEYASRLLTPAERNYSTTEREALAVVWAVSKFRGYIEGAAVTIVTDHQPLKWLMNLRSPSGRLARWALQLQPYNLLVKYTPGRTNVVADTLSRPPCCDEKAVCSLCIITVDMPVRGAAEVRREQQKDSDVRKILDAFEGERRDEDFVRWTNRGYVLNNGVLYRYNPDVEAEEAQLVVPEHERQMILAEHHDAPAAGHYGVEGTIQRISQRYYWPGMRRYITDYVKSCAACQRYKADNMKPAGLLQTPVMQQRFEVIAVDYFGPLPTSPEGMNWIFIVEDTATRWVELFPLMDATAERCAKTLLNEVILRYGTPRRLISDNGTQFVSAIMQHLTFCMGIKQSLTPVYHPAANPVERKNRDLKTQLAMQVGKQHDHWPEALPAIRFAMNTARCQGTGYTAAYLTFGRELRTPDDITRDLRSIVQSENFVSELTPLLLRLSETLRQARETNEKEQDRRKASADTRRRPDQGYKIGDLVWVNTRVISSSARRTTAKLAPRRDGPYMILHRRGPTSYEVANPADPTTTVGTYHSSALAEYEGRDQETPEPLHPIRRRGRPRKQ